MAQNGKDMRMLSQGTDFLASSAFAVFSSRNFNSSVDIVLHFDGESLKRFI